MLNLGQLLLQGLLQRQVALLLIDLRSGFRHVVAVPGEFGIILILRVDLLVLNLPDLRTQVIAIAFQALAELVEKSLLHRNHRQIPPIQHAVGGRP